MWELFSNTYKEMNRRYYVVDLIFFACILNNNLSYFLKTVLNEVRNVYLEIKF